MLFVESIEYIWKCVCMNICIDRCVFCWTSIWVEEGATFCRSVFCVCMLIKEEVQMQINWVGRSTSVRQSTFCQSVRGKIGLNVPPPPQYDIKHLYLSDIQWCLKSVNANSPKLSLWGWKVKYLQLRSGQPSLGEKVGLMILLDKGPCGQCHIILLKQMRIDFIYRLNYEEINRSADDHYGRFTNCHRK